MSRGRFIRAGAFCVIATIGFIAGAFEAQTTAWKVLFLAGSAISLGLAALFLVAVRRLG